MSCHFSVIFVVSKKKKMKENLRVPCQWIYENPVFKYSRCLNVFFFLGSYNFHSMSLSPSLPLSLFDCHRLNCMLRVRYVCSSYREEQAAQATNIVPSCTQKRFLYSAETDKSFPKQRTLLINSFFTFYKSAINLGRWFMTACCSVSLYFNRCWWYCCC